MLYLKEMTPVTVRMAGENPNQGFRTPLEKPTYNVTHAQYVFFYSPRCRDTIDRQFVQLLLGESLTA